MHATGVQHAAHAENDAKLGRSAIIGLAAWTDSDIARFLDRRARLMRWGWAEPEAERLAERLVKCAFRAGVYARECRRTR